MTGAAARTGTGSGGRLGVAHGQTPASRGDVVGEREGEEAVGEEAAN